MKEKTSPYPILQPFHPPYTKSKSLSLHFFPILKSFVLLTYQQNKLWLFQQNYLAIVFFKDIQYGYETFQNIRPALQNHITKHINSN